MAFEPQMQGLFEGQIGNIVVKDPIGRVPETTIIQSDHPWQVEVNWEVRGLFTSIMNPNAKWHLSVIVESLGKGLEDEVGQADVAVGSPGILQRYTTTIPIQPMVNFPEFRDGAYKLVVLLTLINVGVPCPIAGYVDNIVLQFYKSV